MPKTVIPRRVTYSAWADGRRRPFPQPGNVSPAVLRTEFRGLSLVQTNSYPFGIERRFDGTDIVTGQAFSASSPQLWGQRATPVIQFLAANPSADWETEFVTNAPGNLTALRIRRNSAYIQAAQAAYRLFPGVLWNQQGEYYCRKKIFIPAAFPTSANGFMTWDEIKVNGGGEQEDRIYWGFVREVFNGNNRWFNLLRASWTDGTDVGTWPSGTPVTPAQDSSGAGAFYNLGAFSDGDGTTLANAGRWITTEFAVCLHDVSGRVAGNRPSGYVICAITVGTPTAPAPNGTGTVRTSVIGRNMSQNFASSAPSGNGIVFPFNIYSNMAIQGLDFFLHSLEVYDYVPADASFASPNATVPAPVWTGTPAPPQFTVGTPATYSLAQFISGPQASQYTLSSIGAALPGSVAINNTDKTLVYDGGGSAALVTGIRLRATSSGGSNDSASFGLSVTGASRPNVSALPLATGQALATAAYTALNVPSRAAGWSYLDPTTNVKVIKITDASTPVANTTAIPCYFESGPRISHRWGANRYTIDIYLPDASAHYFVDFDYVAETLSNWRLAPAGTNEVGRGFSLKPETPQIYFVLQGGTLRKYDLSSGVAVQVTTGGFPKDLSGNLAGGSRFEWLGFGIDERWFVMMNNNKTRMVAYNAVTDTVRVKTSADAGFSLDEPKMERNGRYVWVRSGAQSARWWDLDTDTFGPISPDASNNYKGHAGTPRGFAVGTQSDAETAQWYAVPPSADPIVVNPADSVTVDVGAVGHWVTQEPADATQYVLLTSNDAGSYGGGQVLLQRAIGLFRINGTDRRLLCQHFSMGNSHTDAYYRGPAWGNISPDGLLVLFKSSMLSTTGRADSFLAKVPTL